VRVELQVDECGLLWMPVTVAGRALRALVDTGAVESHIALKLARELELARVTTFNHQDDPATYSIFDANLVLHGASISVRLFELPPKRFDGLLIGQDVLAKAVLCVDGPARKAHLYLW
jgi:predicted aspartyl protease